jgi:hypothetical protein
MKNIIRGNPDADIFNLADDLGRVISFPGFLDDF